MKQYCYAVLTSFIIIICFKSTVDANDEIVAQLTNKITVETNNDVKARLYLYRARNYYNIHQNSLAEKDYITSLQLKDFGPTWVELYKFYVMQEEYDKAKTAADKIREDFPYLENEFEAMRKLVDKKVKEKNMQGHPAEMIYDQYAYKVRSRIDVKNELLASARAKGWSPPIYRYDGIKSSNKHDSNIHKNEKEDRPSNTSPSKLPVDARIGQCIGDCGSEQGICISQCNGNDMCIANCNTSHGRCVSHCQTTGNFIASNNGGGNTNSIGQCMGNCASEQGVCIGNCMGDGQCIANCNSSHGRCVSRCH